MVSLLWDSLEFLRTPEKSPLEPFPRPLGESPGRYGWVVRPCLPGYWRTCLVITTNAWGSTLANWKSILILILLSESATASSVFSRAVLRGVPGESGHLYLIQPGAYVHPIYNDVNGATDKHLTASMKFGVLQDLSSFSYESTLYWRLLTPAIREHNFADETFKNLKGRFADWMEWGNAFAVHRPHKNGIYVLQVELGLNEIKDHGGRKVHRRFHELIGSGLENLEYENTPDGIFFRPGVQFGVSRILRNEGRHKAEEFYAIQYRSSKMMKELSFNYNLHLTILPTWWEYDFEGRLVRQMSSEEYNDLSAYRYELAAGVLLFQHYSPAVRYVSAYFRGEATGQTYFDVLHYNLLF